MINDHKITTESDFNTFYFYARRMHNNTALDYESTVKLMYANELTNKTEWTQVGETVELTDDYALYSIDASALPAGEYYFALSASSNYIDSDGNTGLILLDHLITPPYPGPKVVDMDPMDGETNVPYDASIMAEFDQDITAVDLNMVSVVDESGEAVTLDSVKLDEEWPELYIYPDTLDKKGETYTVTIPANTVTNGAMPNDTAQWSFTTTLPAPEATLFYPEHMSAGVPLDAEVYARFNHEIALGTGAITITSEQTGAVPVNEVYVDNDMHTLVIDHAEFAYEDTLTVSLEEDAVVNNDDIGSMDTSWTFYTMQEGQPVAATLTPENNNGFVALDATVSIEFSEEVVENDLSGITITGESSGEVSGVSASLTDSTIVISHDDFPENDELYMVTIPEGAVSSVSTGTANSKISWNFTTIMAAPEAMMMDPENGATGVPMDYTQLSVGFDQTLYTTNVDLDTMFTVIGEANDTIPINGSWIAGSNNHMVYLELAEPFMHNHSVYTVTMMESAVHNLDSIYNSEMSWHFTTIMEAPAPTATMPEEGSMDIALDSAVHVAFDQELMVNDLSNVTITSEKMGEVPGVTASYVDTSMTIEITHDGFFMANDDVYTVSIPGNAVKNTDGVPNNPIHFSFSTITTYDLAFEVLSGHGPIEDAHVVLGPDTLMTDTLGEVVFGGIVENTTMEYSIHKEGYRSVAGSVTADAHKILSHTLTQVFEVAFSVNDEDGNAVVGASVTFAGAEDTTNSDGMVTFGDLEAGSYSYYVSNENYDPEMGTMEVNADTTATIALDLTVGINYLSNSSIDVYPNPTSGLLHIDNLAGNEHALLEVIDIHGKVVRKKELNNLDNTIHLHNQAKGVYMLRLHLDDKVVNGKLILK